MKQVHEIVGITTMAVTAVGCLYGGWRWWRAQPSSWFWRLLRAAQVMLLVQVVLGGILVLSGKKPPQLHLIYGLLPLLVSFIAEQLRIASAQMVMDQRGYDSAEEVGTLPEDEQQRLVLMIVMREMGVMVLALLVNVVLLARAAGTA